MSLLYSPCYDMSADDRFSEGKLCGSCLQIKHTVYMCQTDLKAGTAALTCDVLGAMMIIRLVG